MNGGKRPPREITGGKGGMVWIGTKGSLPAGFACFAPRGGGVRSQVPVRDASPVGAWTKKPSFQTRSQS